MKRLYAVFMIFGLIMAASAGQVRAAPQVLGVIAYNEPVPLSCATGQCWAELVTICLQKERANPLAGTDYRFHGQGEAKLILTDAEGGQRTLAAADVLRVRVARGFTAVRVEMTERKMRELGAVSASITVDKGMSLVPLEIAGDPNPISKGELAYVTDFLRPEADRWLDSDDPRAQTTRVVNRMINITPRVGRMSHEDRGTLLSRAEETLSNPLGAEAREKADVTYRGCLYMVEKLGRFYSMRRCLETKHDSLMLDVNSEYWRATTPGS